MSELIPKVQAILDIISHIVFGLVILSTVVVRLTPNKADDKKLDKVIQGIRKFFQFMPTIGLNPKTKELEEWVEKNKK